MYLQTILSSRNNNFDLLRLIAALLVIYGHSFAFVPNVVNTDFVARWLGFEYTGSLAVKFFFLLSGMLVTSSLISKPDIKSFLVKRAARIFPGLFICLLITVFIIGPYFTQLSLSEYFSQKQTWGYLYKNIFLHDLQWFLPGVFSDSKYGVNGSLWTLPLEVVCYLFLAAFYGVGVWRTPILANVVLLGVVVLSFFVPQLLPSIFGNNKEANLLPGCFALGALFAVNKEKIRIDNQGLFALFLLSALLWSTGLKILLFYIFFFYACIYIGTRRVITENLKIPADPSYGVYIYGFAVQQSVAHLFVGYGIFFNQVVAAGVALLLGLISWFVVERPSIKYVNNLLSRDGRRSISTSASLFFDNIQKINISSRSIANFVGMVFIAWLVHFIALYFIFPGYYKPLSFHHSDFYTPATLAYALGELFSFTGLLSWPRPLLMEYLKISGYLGHSGSVGLSVLVVFLNVVVTALFARRFLNLKVDKYFILFFILYCYLLFSQPYFYTFYTHDIGSHLSYLLLTLGFFGFYVFHEKHLLPASIFLCVLGSSAFLVKETYIVSVAFLCAFWFFITVKTHLIRSISVGVALLLAALVSLWVNVKTKSVFLDMGAEKGSAYHIDVDFVGVFKELYRYFGHAFTPFAFIVLCVIFVGMYKHYREKNYHWWVLLSGLLAVLAWLPNALLPFHHYEGYSFNGLYICFAVLFFMVKALQDGNSIKKTFYAVLILSLLSPLSSLKKYRDTRNSWVLSMEKVQVNMLAGFKKATAQLQATEKNITVLVSGISAPFHPFASPHSIRSFAGGDKAVYYFVVPKDFPNNVGTTMDLVNFILPEDIHKMNYDQEWIFDDAGNLVSIKNLGNGIPLNK